MADESSTTVQVQESPQLIAYQHDEDKGWKIEPAGVRREWMDATTGKFAYRCLPLSMANQLGWVVRAPGTFSAEWTGKPGLDALKLKFTDSPPHYKKQVVSNFGHGIISFVLPWIFRTPPGVLTLVRGPSNYWVNGAHALEGLVETDWITSTVSMNYQVTVRNREVWFRKDEPLCMLVPMRLELIEEMQPVQRDIQMNPQLHKDALEWNQKRAATIKTNIDKIMKEGPEVAKTFELDYTRGRTVGGRRTEYHRSNLKLKQLQKE